MSDEKSVYPRIETGYAFTPDMNNDLAENFNNQTFTRGSAFLKNEYYNPINIIVQLITVKEKVNKCEIKRMRNGLSKDLSTSVDTLEIVKIGGKVVEIYEGVIF